MRTVQHGQDVLVGRETPLDGDNGGQPWSLTLSSRGVSVWKAWEPYVCDFGKTNNSTWLSGLRFVSTAGVSSLQSLVEFSFTPTKLHHL